MYRKVRLSLLLSILPFSIASSALARVCTSQVSDDAKAYLSQGLELYSQGKYKESAEAFTHAIRTEGGMVKIARFPEWKEAMYRLGTARSILGDHFGAMATFSGILMNQEGDDAKQVIRLDTEFPQAHYDLGTAYYTSAGRYGLYDFSLEAAAGSFQRAISLKPDYAEAYWYLGLSLNGLHRYEEAIKPHRKALELKPDSAETYNSLGLTYRGLKRYSEAIDAFNKSIALKPDFVAPQYHLGMTYLDIGDHESAMRQYRTLKKLSPEQAKEFRYLLNEAK